ncbi:12437_t:CDS:2 [Cetraspora pellucida]|uniref:12437_t:CDS:1 n=1 Tax=Cetraspora pellucida TaxID=1433469 RepID=A0A9N9B801_9GLOM|nr:12437_t:CDS:2 [Cetraspora pellucida]
MHSEPDFIKSNCLYFYKEELQNICKLSEFDDKQKTMALKLIEKYEIDKKKYAELLKTYKNQITAYSIKLDIFKNRLKLLANIARFANFIIYIMFIQANISVSRHKVQEKQIMLGYNLLTTNPNSKLSQGIKYDLDNKIDEEEYDIK